MTVKRVVTQGGICGLPFLWEGCSSCVLKLDLSGGGRGCWGEQYLSPVSPGKINEGRTFETNAFSLIYIIRDFSCGPRSCVFRNRHLTPSFLCSSFLFPKPGVIWFQLTGARRAASDCREPLLGLLCIMEEARVDRLGFRYRLCYFITVQAWISDSGLSVLTCNLTALRGQFWAAIACPSPKH